VLVELDAIRQRAREYEENPDLVQSIVSEGCERAREAARATMDEVRAAVGLEYR
jgi:tryptophanyl-tRNA synthetase